MTDEEERLRCELSGRSLDGLAATAIFGGGEAFLKPDHHLVIAQEPIPEGEGDRVVAAMAIGPSWLNEDTTSKIFDIQGYLLPYFAIDSPGAPGQFGAMARAARRNIDRRAAGIGVMEIGDTAAANLIEGRFRCLALGVNEKPNSLEVARDRTIEGAMGLVALTAVVRFPRPFADMIHGIPNPFADISRVLPEVRLPDRHLLPA